MFKKMRNKLLITNMVIVAALVIVCLSAIYITTRTSIQNDINSRLNRANEICINNLQHDQKNGNPPNGNPPNGNPPEGTLPPFPGDAGVGHTDAMKEANQKGNREDRFSTEISVYCDRDGKIISTRSIFIDGEFDYTDKFAEIIASNKCMGSVNLDVDSWAFKCTEFKDGYVISFTKNAAEKKILITLGLMLFSAALLSIGISFVISLFSANRSIKPIEESYNKQKQFVADASHELRTPLASISANTDVLLSKKESTIGEEKKWLEYIKDETERMTKLTNDLLTLARSDAEDKGTEVYPEVSFSDITDDIILENDAIAFENKIVINDDIEENIKVTVPAECIKQIVFILIDNALKYTPCGGRIDVSLKTEGENAVFSISNDGEIKKEDLPHVFERFYRADKSRARESGGYGLGLAIAQSLCKGMGGSVKVDSGNNRTTFTVSIPIEK